MNPVLSFIINLIIFLLSLGALIVIHELGHFTTAKIFKVYCHEFSIGMGPAIFKHKRKNGETTFALRCLPLGGYVAMAGEEEDIDEKDLDTSEVVVPKERTLEGIARWKRVIVMAAGVVMNFIVGYLLFFINYAAVPQLVALPESTKIYVPIPEGEEDKGGLAYQAGLRDGDEIKNVSIIYYSDNAVKKEIINQEVKVYAYEETVDNSQFNYSISNLLASKWYNSETDEILDFSPKKESDYRLVYFTYVRDGVTFFFR